MSSTTRMLPFNLYRQLLRTSPFIHSFPASRSSRRTIARRRRWWFLGTLQRRTEFSGKRVKRKLTRTYLYWPWWAFAPARSLSAALWKGFNVIHGSYKYTREIITYKKERSCARLRDSRPGTHVRVTQPSIRFSSYILYLRVLWYLYFHQRCNFQMDIMFHV